MSDFPENIAVGKCHPFRGDNFYVGASKGARYLLATPEALADAPEVVALVQAAVKAERGRCAALADAYSVGYADGTRHQRGTMLAHAMGMKIAADSIAAAIRAGGEP